MKIFILKILLFILFTNSFIFSDSTSELILAVKDNNIEKVIELIENNVDINEQDNKGWTALFYTALKGYTEIAKILIESGADVNIESEDQSIALHYACIHDHDDCAELLIKAGSNVNKFGKYTGTPLMKAVDSPKIVELLINVGADVNAHEWDGITALHCAADNGDVKSVELLLKAGAFVDGVLKIKVWTPLCLSAIKNRIDVAELLLEYGANINYQDSQGKTPLMLTLSPRSYDMVEFFIKEGADLNIRDKNGMTALDIAIMNNYHDIVNLLLWAGENLII